MSNRFCIKKKLYFHTLKLHKYINEFLSLLLVLGELEGIARGHKDDRVTEKARFALNFLQNGCSFSNIKCVTTRGSVLPSTRFTSEEDYSKVSISRIYNIYTCNYVQ